MLLSWGWNAKKVEVGGGGINVVMTCQSKIKFYFTTKTSRDPYKISRTKKIDFTLNVIILNNETFPPAADIT